MVRTNIESTRLNKELHALTQTAKAINSPLELQELLDAVMKTIVEVLEQSDVGAIMLWDQSVRLFHPAAAVGYDLDVLKEIGLQAGESITGKVYEEGKACLLCTPDEVSLAMADMRPNNRDIMARSIGSQALPTSAVATPVAVGDRKFGVLVLEALNNHKQFVEDDLPFVQTLADLIALAIDRANLQAHADVVRETHQKERMRAEVMATLSHELRIPLSAIKGYATALMLDEIPWGEAKRDEFMRQIVEACDDMEGMILDMLDSALIDVEQLKLELQPLRLQNIAREMAMEFQHRGVTDRLIVDFTPNFPIVQADSRWIKQVFRNILDNAIKYSPDGGLIMIKGESRPVDVVITIADQGVGIAPENLIPLFERYFRVRSTTLHVPGTGLGLPIARSIIEAHGGRIWVESKVGEGTSIGFSLPRNKSTPESPM
jgi:K+-sensing histidine kinase KdpD